MRTEKKNILLIFYKIYYDKYITARINVTGQLNTHFIRASLVFIIFFFSKPAVYQARFISNNVLPYACVHNYRSFMS